MPINKSYTALQRAVVECAYAGCETIWITVSHGQTPMVRDLLGDYVEDPVWYYRKKARFPKENKKQIPIFYVPVHPKDVGRRDCEAWGILNSAMSAYYTSKKISKWLMPNKYYVAPVYGVYEPSLVQEYRSIISSHTGAFYFTHEGSSVASGKRLGFTFDTESFVRVRKQFRDLEKDRRKDTPRPGRFFQAKEIFNVVDPDFVEGATTVEVLKYSDISFWNGYVDYMAHPFVEMPQIKILKNGKKTFALPPIV